MARFREGRTIRAGDGVVVVGFPLRGLLASEATMSTGIVNALAGIGNDTRFLQISAPYNLVIAEAPFSIRQAKL